MAESKSEYIDKRDGLNFDNKGKEGKLKEGTIRYDLEQKYKAHNASRNRFQNLRMSDDKKYSLASLDVITKYKNQVEKAGKIKRYDNDKGVYRTFNVVDNLNYKVENGKAVQDNTPNVFRKDALKFFDDAEKKLKSKINKLTGLNDLMNHGKKNQALNTIVKWIDYYENEALLNIEKVANTKQIGRNAEIDRSLKRDKKGNISVKNGKIETQKKVFEQSDETGYIIFSDASNPLKFHEAVKGLFNQETIKINGKVKKYYPRYEIDYNCCKSQNVKNKMKNLTGSLKGELYYDSNSKTYYIEGKNGKKIPAKNIGIYEGVRLKREEIKQYEAHIEDERKKEELGKVDVDKKSNDKPENDPELKQYIDDIPKELREELEKLGNEEYRTFIISVENELADILRENIKLGYNLQGEFVSTDPLGINITIDLINSNINETKNVTFYLNIFRNKKLENLFHPYKHPKNFRNLMKYLSKRLPSIRDKLIELKPRRNMLLEQTQVTELPNLGKSILTGEEFIAPSNEGKEKVPEKKFESVYTGITLLREQIEYKKKDEGRSYLDGDDMELDALLEILDNYEYTINLYADRLSNEDFTKLIRNFSHDLANAYKIYDTNYKNVKDLNEKFFTILYDDDLDVKVELISGFGAKRKWHQIKMSDDTRYVQDGSRSYLLEQYTKSEIKGNQAETRIEINDSDINKYYEKINKLYMNIEYDDNGKMIITDKNRPIKEAIDRLYNECDDNTGKKIAEILTELEILPEGWENDDDVLKMCKKIAENLKNNKKRCEKLGNMKTVKDNLYKEKLKLQQKDDKTEEDKKTIRLLEDFEKNPTEYEQYCKSYIGMIQEGFLYGGINDLVSQSLTSVFADKGGGAKESGAKGHAGKLYNEMTGQGLLNFSDNTHKRIYGLCDDAINNAVVTLITLGIAEAISATGLATSISAKFSNAAANIIAKLKSMLPTRAINALKKAKDFLLKIWTRAKDSAPKVMNYTTEAFKKFPDLKKFTRDAFLKNIREGKQNPFEGITVQGYISSYVQSVTMGYINGLTGIAGGKIGDLVNKYGDDFFQKCGDFLERNQYLKEYLEAIDPKAMEEGIKGIIEKKVKNYFEEKGKEIGNKIHNDLLKINLNIGETINFNFKMDGLSRFLDDTSMIEIAKYRLNQDLRFKISNQSKKPNALDIFNFIESLIYINRDKPRFVSSLIEGLNKGKKEISFGENGDIYAINTETGSKNTLEELFNSAA